MRYSRRIAARSRRPAAGFSIFELVVALAVTVLVLVGVLTLFDLNTKMARAQTNLAEMQQSARVGQHTVVRRIRMAGRGALPVGTLPTGSAIEICNNAQVDPACDRTEIATDFDDSPTIVAGTDVVTVRGVFTAPLWQVNHTDPATFSIDTEVSPVAGTLRISSISHTGVPQPTAALVEALSRETPVPEPLVLVSPLGDQIFAVVEIDPTNSDISDPDNLVLGFKFTDGEHTTGYQNLTGGAVFPEELTSVAFAGILEEYRYYVRAEYTIPGDDTSELRPRLSMARMFPASEVPYAGSLEQAQMDIADNIMDLQVSLGIDLNADGVVQDDGDGDDEWLFNHPDDDPDPAIWNVAGRRLSEIRISTLARTERADRNYRSPPIESIEDHEYTEPDVPTDPADREARMYRRRLLESVIDLRNL